MRRALVLSGVTTNLLACGLTYLSEGGQIPPDGPPSTQDVEASAEAAPTDASTDRSAPARCQPTDAFGPPHEVVLPFTGTFYGATLTIDEQTLLYSTSTTTANLFRAERRTGTDVFERPSRLAVENNGNEYTPSASADRTLLVYSASPLTNFFDHPLRLKRNSIDALDASSTLTPSVIIYARDTDGGQVFDDTPYLLPSARALYFARYSNPLSSDIFRADESGDSFGTPTRVLASARAPVVSDDELTMFVARYDTNRWQTYALYRSTTSTPWASVSIASVAELASPQGIQPQWLSSDGCVLYVSVDESKLRYVKRGEK